MIPDSDVRNSNGCWKNSPVNCACPAGAQVLNATVHRLSIRSHPQASAGMTGWLQGSSSSLADWCINLQIARFTMSRAFASPQTRRTVRTGYSFKVSQKCSGSAIWSARSHPRTASGRTGSSRFPNSDVLQCCMGTTQRMLELRLRNVYWQQVHAAAFSKR